MRSRSIICTHTAFVQWKYCKKSVQYIRRYSTKYVSFWRVVPEVHKCALSTLELQDQTSRNFTWYRGIIYAVSAHIKVAISHSIQNARAINEESLPFFHKIGIPWQCPLRYPKKRSRSIICNQNAFIQWNNCENQSSRSWNNRSPSDHWKITRIPSGIWSRLYGLLTQSKICAPQKSGPKLVKIF